MSSVMNSLYNNYITTYHPKSVPSARSSKKSDVQSTYNSIVKMNKDTPWYLPTTSKEIQQYAVDLKKNATDLHDMITDLNGLDQNDSLRKKSAYSSDPGAISATFIGEEIPIGIPEEFSIEVNSLASSQENMGLFLPDSPVALPPNMYSFEISINDMNYEFQFSIGESETNRDVQDRLARLINNSSIGLKAKVLEEDHRSALCLTSESTGLPPGKKQIFSVGDERTSKAKGTVGYFGLDYVSREGSDAKFKINGEDRSASSNHFTVSKLFSLELKGTTPPGEEVTIGLKTDVESVTDNIKQLIHGYNEFMKAASSYTESHSRSRALIREMSHIAGDYSNDMETLGLSLSNDGTISVDNEHLKQAAEEVQNNGGSFDYLKDFSRSLLRKSNEVSLNPMDYVEKTVVAYKNPGHNYVSPYTPSNYSGMMFNYYC